MSFTRSSTAARQERIDQLRRDRAAAVALRVAFPAVQHLRLELKFESSSAGSLKTDVKSKVRRAAWKRASLTRRGDTTDTALTTNA